MAAISEDMADIPEESIVDTDSDGVGLGEYYENDSDFDQDQDNALGD
jgi:hypothetical protein